MRQTKYIIEFFRGYISSLFHFRHDAITLKMHHSRPGNYQMGGFFMHRDFIHCCDSVHVRHLVLQHAKSKTQNNILCAQFKQPERR